MTTDRKTDPSLKDLNPALLLAAGIMIAVGGALALTGAGLAGTALVVALRRWYRRTELPAGELARLKWEQARAAAGAGAGAWRDTEAAKYPR